MKLDIFNTDGCKSTESLAVKCKLLDDYSFALKDRNHKISIIDERGKRSIDVVLGDLVVSFTERLEIDSIQLNSRYYASSNLELELNFLDILDDIVVRCSDTEVFELEGRTVYCNSEEGLVLISRHNTLLALYNIGSTINDVELKGGILSVYAGALLIMVNVTDYSTVASYNINPTHRVESIQSSLFKMDFTLPDE